MSDALIAGGPLAVVLEDLHWADAASLDLLAQVGAVAGGTGVTIIGTVRSPAPSGSRRPSRGPGPVRRRDAPARAVHRATRSPSWSLRLRRPTCTSAPAACPCWWRPCGPDHGSADLAVVVSGLLAALTPAQRLIIEAAAVLGESVDEHILAGVVAQRRGAAGARPQPAGTTKASRMRWRLHGAAGC